MEKSKHLTKFGGKKQPKPASVFSPDTSPEQQFKENTLVTCSWFSEWLGIVSHPFKPPYVFFVFVFVFYFLSPLLVTRDFSEVPFFLKNKNKFTKATGARDSEETNNSSSWEESEQHKLRLNNPAMKHTHTHIHHLLVFVTQTLCGLTATLGHAEVKGRLPVRLRKHAESLLCDSLGWVPSVSLSVL